MCCSHVLPEDEFVDIPCEHGASGEDGGICRRHDGGGHSSQPDEGDDVRAEVLEHQRKDELLLILRNRHNAFIVGLIPV